MHPKRYVGKDISQLLEAIKHDFGDDAIILSNKTVREGTEIYAISAQDMSQMLSEHPEQSGEVLSPVSFDQKVSELLPGKTAHKTTGADMYAAQAASVPVRPTFPEVHVPVELPVDQTVSHRPDHVQGGGSSLDLMKQMMSEMADMKKTLTEQIAGLQWKKTVEQHPAKEAISRLLLQCGYSTKLCKDLIAEVPPHILPTTMYGWLRDALSSRILMHENDRDALMAGGVYSFLGTTGVGKTTSIAKLAARFVLQHGPESVLLLTTDHYRACAYEQLRIFGDLLSVPVFSVRSASDLRTRLIEYKEKKAILIDTQGVCQKNTADIHSLLALLSQSVALVKRYVVCSCTSTKEHCQEVIDAYQPSSSYLLSGCILTKLDEAASISPVIDTVIRSRLPISYVSYGTRFPDDWSTPNRQYLLTQALNPVSTARDNLFDRASTQALMSGTEIASHSLV